MYSTAIDIFSLGLVYDAVFARELPRIQDATNAPAYFAALRSGRRPDSRDTPKSARAVITACWRDQAPETAERERDRRPWSEIEATIGRAWPTTPRSSREGRERPSRFGSPSSEPRAPVT